MRKIRLQFLVSCLLASVFTLSACGTYTPAQNSGGNSSSSNSSGITPEVDPEDENLFTVHLVYNDKAYKPTVAMEAFWTDGFSYNRASFEEDGVARIGGLDGDYRVTLSNVPEGFAYDPSAYVATNDNKHVTIELFSIKKTVGKGNDLYSPILLNATGVYEATITSIDQIIYYRYDPTQAGTYSFESWVDVTENMVNPKIDIYRGTFAAWYPDKMNVDSGGVESTYTKNFKYEVQVAAEQIGNNFLFGLKAEVTSSYPQKIWFALKRDGGFERDKGTSVYVVPAEDFSGKYEKYGRFENDGTYTLTTPEVYRNGAWQYDGSMFKLNEEDGWYHVYDQETDTYGEILYAHIVTPCQFYDAASAFNAIEYAGNKVLTLKSLDKESTVADNFKLFIEGKDASSMGAFCVRHPLNQQYCPCHAPYAGGFCLVDCPTCHAECNTLPSDVYYAMTEGDGGYADWCNTDGLYPVTPELKDFLYRFSTSQLLFMDGAGWCESEGNLSGKQVDSKEEDQWLFACAYYKKNA